MSNNKVKKTVSLNKTNPNDLKIIQKVNQDGFNFNEWARKVMIEAIRNEERMTVQRTEAFH
ncbi:hypothetical protein ACFYKT_01580 [Cytobacillus sp. FJAT-53684]|uniref:Uncharacterized protein n=1 Tax=Cytobacillus mangrovibacter TaxID=3299024 RepID=A0ABW6JT67_9BACI